MGLKFIETTMVPIGELMYAPWNYKEKDADMSKSLSNFMMLVGNCVEISVAQRAEEPKNKKWEVIDGNHRLEIYHQKKVKTVPVKKHGRLSIQERMVRGMGINENRFDSDVVKMAGLFSKMNESPEKLAEYMPFSEQQIIEFIDLSRYDPDEMRERLQAGRPSPIPSVTLHATVEQAYIIEQAVERWAKGTKSEPHVGMALEGICKRYLEVDDGSRT